MPPTASRPVRLWDMVDGPVPRGVLGLGDPNVHVVDGRTTMFLGGFSTTFRNRLYTAVLDDGADPATGPWRVETDDRRRAQPLVADPPRHAWDGAGMHTPSYVPAVADRPARVYYTGRSSRKQYGATSRYAIGALELVDGQWRRLDGPLVRGDSERGSVLEPRVVHDGRQYLMWFQANPYEMGPGDPPDHELRVARSDDGVTWSAPQVFASTDEAFFDNALARTRDGWLMVLSRSADLHGTGGFPPQGLWVATADTPSPDRDDWSEPVHVLRTDDPGTPAWLARGTYGPGVLHTDEGRSVVFATAVRTAPRWPRFVAGRLLRGQPVVPAPFYLSVLACELTDVSRSGPTRPAR